MLATDVSAATRLSGGLEPSGSQKPAHNHAEIERTITIMGSQSSYADGMCRSIKTLREPYAEDVTDDDVRAAALQYVRKISGYTKPSHANEAVFAAAVDEIAVATANLLNALETSSNPKSREVEAARAKARSLQRFGGQQPAERQVS